MKKYLIFVILIAALVSIFIGYQKYSDRIELTISNRSNREVEWGWFCNKQLNPSRFKSLSREDSLKTIYPSCEGVFGIRVFLEVGSEDIELSKYVPAGSPLKFEVSIPEKGKVTFNELK